MIPKYVIDTHIDVMFFAFSFGTLSKQSSQTTVCMMSTTTSI